jgi:hypothetical protein
LGAAKKWSVNGSYSANKREPPRALRQLRKQVQPVSFEPAIKRPIVDPFQGKQDANADNFTRIQVRVFALVDMRQVVVSHTKESNANLFGSQQVVLLFAMVSLLAQEWHHLLSFANPTFQLATLVN